MNNCLKHYEDNIVLTVYRKRSNMRRADCSFSFESYFSGKKRREEIGLNYNHIYKIYMLEQSNSRQACIYVNIVMHFLMGNNDLKSINYLIDTLDKNLVTSWSLIPILRNTYSNKSRMPKWNNLYETTYNQVRKEGLNPSIELIGLKD